MICALVESDTFNGNSLTNPFNLIHKNLTQISVQVDGISFPSKPYQLDFEKFIGIIVGLCLSDIGGCDFPSKAGNLAKERHLVLVYTGWMVRFG